jgi:acetamidase/formamidase
VAPKPCDTLQVDILAAKLRIDWCFVSVMPWLGTLPDKLTDYETIHPVIDHVRNVCRLARGMERPLDPFCGINSTAPPLAWSCCGSPVPRSFEWGIRQNIYSYQRDTSHKWRMECPSINPRFCGLLANS